MLSFDPEWYYIPHSDLTANKIRGPVSERDIDALYKASDINEYSLFWREDLPEWKPLRDLPIYSAISIDNQNTESKHSLPPKPTDSETEPKSSNLVPDIKDNEIPDEILLKAKDILSNKNTEALSSEKLKKIMKTKKRKEKQKTKWYTPKINSNIYVQGLPKDITKKEVVDFFGKAGVLRLDPETGEERIKLYTDNESGELKGDATISYFSEESVDIALEFLNGKEIRTGYPLKLERAVFQPKGEEYIPRTKKQINEIAKIKFKANKEKIFSWNDEESSEGLKIVVLKHMFGIDDFTEETREQFFKVLEDDIRYEVEQLGEIKRMEIFEFNPDGVVKIKFAKGDSAVKCIELLNNRYYNGRLVECNYYDGISNYRVNPESLEQENKRIDDFGKWLATQINEKNNN